MAGQTGPPAGARPVGIAGHNSRAGDVVPFAGGGESAQFTGATLVAAGGDHRLADREPPAAVQRGGGGGTE